MNENAGWWVSDITRTGWEFGEERRVNQMITCSPAVVDNLSEREGQAKDLGRLAAFVSAGRGSMRIDDTGMQAMHQGEVVAAAADSVHVVGTVAARRTGCAKIQQPLEGGGRYGVVATGDIAGMENQLVVGTAPERATALSGKVVAQQRIYRASPHSALVLRSSLRVPMLPGPSAAL
jgi:hypothetical protein